MECETIPCEQRHHGAQMNEPQRLSEWFVPSFGPPRFRVAVGLLFLPYTGMVLSFVVIGSMLAETIRWDRVAAIVVIYFLALGIGAHALDALGSKAVKPWGSVFSKRQLWAVAAGSMVVAYAIGLYYIVRYAPLLGVIAVLRFAAHQREERRRTERRSPRRIGQGAGSAPDQALVVHRPRTTGRQRVPADYREQLVAAGTPFGVQPAADLATPDPATQV